MRRAVAGTLLLGAALGASPAGAQLYRWTDERGTVHFTGDPATIPLRHREGVTVLDVPTPRPAPPTDPVVLRATPGAPITVEARLNGVPLRLIVDTGAERTVLSPDVVGRAGFGAEPGVPIRIVGATGSASATLVTVPILDVAGARLGPLPVIVHALPDRHGAEPVDGLLGRDVLEAFTLTVDAASGQATLELR